VQGLASSSPFIADDPLDPQNRRISIIVMNREAEDRFFRPQLDTAAEPAAAASQAEPSIRPQRPMLVSSQPIVGR
jgi:chemotaxis protein MotB